METPGATLKKVNNKTLKTILSGHVGFPVVLLVGNGDAFATQKEVGRRCRVAAAEQVP